MRRLIFVTAFTLTFLGLVAIAGSTSTVEGAGRGSIGNTVAPATRIAETPATLPANPPDSSFGRLMPDGTYCGVGCPSEP